MANAQKTVAAMLVAIMLLEFGSLVKLQKIWDMATLPGENTGPDFLRVGRTEGNASISSPGGQIQLQTPTHPGVQL